MKKNLYFTIVCLMFLVTACDASLSETALQTAVSEAIMTSSAQDMTEGETIPDEDMVADSVSKQEFENVENLLAQAQLELTQQADQINDLTNELEQLYPLLTPSSTPKAPTPTNTPQATATPPPTETPQGGLLFNQKYVVTLGSIPVYTYKDENDAGYPIMYKTDPIQKIAAGEKVIVNIYPVRADGGEYFYLIIGPQHGGFYILVNDVQDYTG